MNCIIFALVLVNYVYMLRGENAADIHVFTFLLIYAAYIELPSVGYLCVHGEEICSGYTCIHISSNMVFFY